MPASVSAEPATASSKATSMLDMLAPFAALDPERWPTIFRLPAIPVGMDTPAFAFQVSVHRSANVGVCRVQDIAESVLAHGGSTCVAPLSLQEGSASLQL